MDDISANLADISDIPLQDDHVHDFCDQLKTESVDSVLVGSTNSTLGDLHCIHSTPIKYNEGEQELARIINEIDSEMDDELADYGCNLGSSPVSLPTTPRFDTLSTPTQLLAHTNSDSARVTLLMEQLRRCQTQLREAKYRCDVLEVERDSQERMIQDKMQSRIETLMYDAAKTEMRLKGKLAEQQAENKALLDQLQQSRDDLEEKTRNKATTTWKHVETMQRLQSELNDSKLMLKKSEAQLQEELQQRKDTAEHIVRLNNQIQILQTEKQNALELTRKSNLLEEQVHFLTKSLEDSRREHALKVAAVEKKLLTENNKLKVNEKDYQRKYKREQQRNHSHSQNIKVLAAEMRQVKEDMKLGAFTDRVKSPVGAGWNKIRLESKKNQKALQDILQVIESERGPDSNYQHASDAAYFQIVIFYLWWKREDSIKILMEMRERLKTFDNYPSNFKEVITERDTLKERVQEHEERLSDWMAENDTLQSSLNLTTTQLVSTKHELELKVQHLQDTVSALHMDNNLLRAELERSPRPRVSAQVHDLTANLKLKLEVAETELKQEKLVTEELGTELKHATMHCDQLTRALQEKDDDHRQSVKKSREASTKVINLEKKKTVMEAQISRLQQENANVKDTAQKQEKKLRSITADISQIKQKQDRTNRARDALKTQIDTLKGELIEVRGQNVNLTHENETLEDRLGDLQEYLEKTKLQLEVQQQEIVGNKMEEQVETQVLTDTLKSEQDRVEELDLEIIRKTGKITQLKIQLKQEEKKNLKKVQVEKAKCKSLQEALKEMENTISKLQQNLRDEVAERNSKLLNLKHQLAVQESRIHENSGTEIVKIQEQLEEQEREFADRKREKEDKIKALEHVLADKEGTVTELEMQMADILEEKAGVISNLQTKMSELDRTHKTENQIEVSHLKDLEECMMKLTDDLQDEKSRCKDLKKGIKERNEDISKLVKHMEGKVEQCNDTIATLESDLKNQEDAKGEATDKMSDLQDRLAQQERMSSTRLQLERDKCQALQACLVKKDDDIAELEQKLLQENLTPKILTLEKQLKEQERNVSVEVDEERDRLAYLEDNCKEKEAIALELRRQLEKLEENKSLMFADQKRTELNRTEEMIKLEDKMSILIAEKDKMHDKLLILSKEKTVLQADKQLLELELADRTQKLQRIMKQSSITGPSSSRSSSRRSSIDSRSGKIRKDSDKDIVKKGKNNKKSTLLDGVEKKQWEIAVKDTVCGDVLTGGIIDDKSSIKFSSTDMFKVYRGNMPTTISESAKTEEEERLRNIDAFVTQLLDLHSSEETEIAIDNLRSDIDAIQKKATSGSIPPVEKQNVVVAKLGALYQIMKFKQVHAQKNGKLAEGHASKATVMEEESEMGRHAKHHGKSLSGIPQPETSFTKKEKCFLQSMPPLILEAITSNNEEMTFQQQDAENLNQTDSQISPDSSKLQPKRKENSTKSLQTAHNKDGIFSFSFVDSLIKPIELTETDQVQSPQKSKLDSLKNPVENIDKQYEKCTGLGESKKAARRFKTQEGTKEYTPEEIELYATSDFSYDAELNSKTDDTRCFVDEDGDDDVFCEEGAQNETELERLAIMHELVTQLRQSPDNKMQVNVNNRDEVWEFCASQGEDLVDSAKDHIEVDLFEPEAWLLEIGEMVAEKQEKPQVLKPNDEIILPIPLENNNKYNAQSTGGEREDDNYSDEIVNEDHLEMLMEALSYPDDIDVKQVDSDYNFMQPLQSHGLSLNNTDDTDQESWLTDVAGWMRINQEHPQILVPDEEVVEPFPLDAVNQTSSHLLRKLQPYDLESKVESCLYSLNPDKTNLSTRMLSNSDSDNSSWISANMTRGGGLNHTTSFEDAKSQIMIESENGIDSEDQQVWHRNLLAKLQDYVYEEAVVKENKEKLQDVNKSKLADFGHERSYVSQEDLSDLDWSSEKQAKHTGLKEYPFASNGSAHGTLSDSSEKRGKRSRSPSQKRSKIPISTEIQEVGQQGQKQSDSSNDLLKYKSHVEETNPNVSKRNRICKDNKLKLKKLVKKENTVSQKVQHVKETIPGTSEVPLYATNGVINSSMELSKLETELPLTGNTSQPERQNRKDYASSIVPTRFKQNIRDGTDLAELPQPDKQSINSNVKLIGLPHQIRQNIDFNTDITGVPSTDKQNKVINTQVIDKIAGVLKPTEEPEPELSESDQLSSDIHHEQFGDIGITQCIDQPVEEIKDVCDGTDKKTQSVADDKASFTLSHGQDELVSLHEITKSKKNFQGHGVNKETQTEQKNMDNETQTSNENTSTPTLENIPKMSSSSFFEHQNKNCPHSQKQSQDDFQLQYTYSVECQTQDLLLNQDQAKQSIPPPCTSTAECQTDETIPEKYLSINHNTNDKLSFTSFAECQTDDVAYEDHHPSNQKTNDTITSTSSTECQTDEVLLEDDHLSNHKTNGNMPSTSSAKCQTDEVAHEDDQLSNHKTNDKIPSTLSAECQTDDGTHEDDHPSNHKTNDNRLSTSSTECQTDEVVHEDDQLSNHKTGCKIPSTMSAECQTDDEAHEDDHPSNHKTNDKIPSISSAGCQTDEVVHEDDQLSNHKTGCKIPSKSSAECQTDEIICKYDKPSNHKTNNMTPSMSSAECQTDEVVHGDTGSFNHKTNDKIQSTSSAECQTDEVVYEANLSYYQKTNDKIQCTSSAACQTDGVVDGDNHPSKHKTNDKISSTLSAECQTDDRTHEDDHPSNHKTNDNRLSTSSTECQTDEVVHEDDQLSNHKTGCKIPSTMSAECQTDDEVHEDDHPSNHKTNDKIPSISSAGCQTDEVVHEDDQLSNHKTGCKIPSKSSAECQTDEIICKYDKPSNHKTNNMTPSMSSAECQTDEVVHGDTGSFNHKTNDKIQSTSSAECQTDEVVYEANLSYYQKTNDKIQCTSSAACQTDGVVDGDNHPSKHKTNDKISSTSSAECQTDIVVYEASLSYYQNTNGKLPSISSAECQTDGVVDEDEHSSNHKTNDKILSTSSAECQTDGVVDEDEHSSNHKTNDKILSTSSAECQTDGVVDENEHSSNHKTNDKILSTSSAECQTDGVVDEDEHSSNHKTNDKILSTSSAECQTDGVVDEDEHSSNHKTNDKILSTSSAECQTDGVVDEDEHSSNHKTNDKILSTSSAECQTDGVVDKDEHSSNHKTNDKILSTSSAECQMDEVVNEDDHPSNHNTNDKISSTSSAECQTDEVVYEASLSYYHNTNGKLPSISFAECQTDGVVDEDEHSSNHKTNDKILSTSSAECQTDGVVDEDEHSSNHKTNDKILSTSSAECQTDGVVDENDESSNQKTNDKTLSTSTVGCQTDLEDVKDDTIEITLKDRIEDLQNLSDRQKMKAKAFKETAKTYKGELHRMGQQMLTDREDLAVLQDIITTQEAQLHQLTHKNNELQVDLNLTSNSLDKKKDECEKLQQAVYDADVKERDLTSMVKEIQDQLNIEAQMQDKLNDRCSELESEILDIRSELRNTDQDQHRATFNTQSGTGENSGEIQTLSSPTKTAKQVQNETDDRKKLSELVAKANHLEAQGEIDKIIIDSLTEENQHLRGIITKLKYKAYSKWKENPDSRLEDIYQALAKAQVKALAMKLVKTPDDMLNNTTTAFGDTLTPRYSRPSSGLGTTLDSEYDCS